MYVFDKPGGKLKQDLSLDDIVSVVQFNTSDSCTPMSPTTAKNLSVTPTDFPEPFAIFTKEYMFLLWAKTQDEQTMWRRELKCLVVQSPPVSKDKISSQSDNMTRLI